MGEDRPNSTGVDMVAQAEIVELKGKVRVLVSQARGGWAGAIDTGIDKRLISVIIWIAS